MGSRVREQRGSGKMDSSWIRFCSCTSTSVWRRAGLVSCVSNFVDCEPRGNGWERGGRIAFFSLVLWTVPLSSPCLSPSASSAAETRTALSDPSSGKSRVHPLVAHTWGNAALGKVRGGQDTVIQGSRVFTQPLATYAWRWKPLLVLYEQLVQLLQELVALVLWGLPQEHNHRDDRLGFEGAQDSGALRFVTLRFVRLKQLADS
eukprot:scaffold4971_cov254-Pinguiococcus_pyrenoidosus.AAC.2